MAKPELILAVEEYAEDPSHGGAGYFTRFTLINGREVSVACRRVGIGSNYVNGDVLNAKGEREPIWIDIASIVTAEIEWS